APTLALGKIIFSLSLTAMGFSPTRANLAGSALA
ncbi:secreted protein, partial [Candidatus Magnetomorum sp. HK-1]